LPAEYVSSEEGTGCVHIAPGHGEEDYQVWLRYKDKKENLGMIMPVDEKGRFNEEAGEFAGMKTDESNKAIINKLHDKNKLVLAEEAYHSYPHCWRCKKPIIFRATWQWFINIDHDNLRDKLKESIKKNVEWIPARGRERILSMIENRPDWCLSRQRYWGVPIPVFYCKKCNQALLNADIIYHLAEMVKKRGLNVWFEKEAKELLPDDIKCPNCQGDDFRKETDILDVWFDSGISHQAVLRTRDNLHFPADLYLEGSDQHRGWFQTSLITSLGIENKSPYRKVLTHGFIIDEKGKKMSKSEGNVISADVVMKDLGADILRLWVASSDYHRDVNLSDTILKRTAEAYRKIRNTLRFALGNLYDFDKNKSLDYEDLFEVDKWALDRIYQLYSDCTKFYKEYNLHKVSHHIYNFCTVDMSSFYLDILKDRLYTQAKHSKARKSAQTVLYELFGMLAKLIAPILSFTAEEAWSYLKNKETESIFLSSFNESKINSWKNEKIRDNWKKLLKVRDIVLKSLEGKRSEKIIGNSLQADVAIFLKDSSLYEFLNLYKDRLSNIFMVSRVTLKKVDKIPVNAVKEEEKNNIAVKVKKTEYAKCPRCWRHVKILGQDKDCPDVCSRCAEAMRENK
jgi:isoleucyl-tRNA synthetase